MKRIVSILLAISFVLVFFTACGERGVPDEPTTVKATEAIKTGEDENTTKKSEETTGTPRDDEITGVYIACDQDDWGFSENQMNQIEFKNGKAYVQMNLFEGVIEVETDYECNKMECSIILGEGKNNDSVVFKAGVKLFPDEYWENMEIHGMEEAFCAQGFNCPQFFEEGTIFEKLVK